MLSIVVGRGLRACLSSCVLVAAALTSTAVLAVPTVTLTIPAANKTYGNPASIPLAATATPSAGTSITKVEFLRGSTVIVSINAPGPYTYTWNYAVNGTYSITAKATDSAGGTKTSSPARSITIVNNTPPTVSLTSPVGGDVFINTDSITFEATATDSGGSIAKVEFFRGGSTFIGSKTSAPYEYTSGPLPLGTHLITAKATDNLEGVKVSNPVSITVVPPPGPPSVGMAAPANGTSFAFGAPINLTATASTVVPAEVFYVEFFRGGTTLIGQVYAPPPLTFAWPDAPVGTHSITARVTDNYLGTATSAPVTITVTPPIAPRVPPTITLTTPAPGTVLQGSSPIVLSATASTAEPGASITNVQFFDDTTPLATVSTPPYTYTWSNPSGAPYFFKATATDTFGATTTTPTRYVPVDSGDSCDTTPPLSAADPAPKLAAFGSLPITFEANKGQVSAEVGFISRGPGYQLFLAPTESVVALSDAKAARGVAVRMRLLGANEKPKLAGIEPVARKSHYLAGRDPSQWKSNVPHFAKVRYESVYAGIDQVFYGTEGRLEYDLHVSAGADPSTIRFSLEGMDRLSLDGEGNLVLETPLGSLVQKRPVAYQEIGGRRQVVAASYKLTGHEVAFELGAYDESQPLVIDPVLVYSTYLGGSNDQSSANTIALSRCGEAFIGGWTYATDFPTTAGAFDRTSVPGTMMGFVSKMNQTGTALLYSTYITGNERNEGGSVSVQSTEVTAISVDGTGHAYVAGQTSATDFPVTPGAYITVPEWLPAGFVTKLTADGSAPIHSTYMPYGVTALGLDAAGNAYIGGGFSATVSKLNPTGTGVLYTFNAGGSGNPEGNQYDYVRSIVVDASGNAYAAGTTYSVDLPVTTGVFQQSKPNAGAGPKATGFVSKINAGGTGLVFGTYLGTGGWFYLNGMTVDASGNVYVTGMADTVASIPNFVGTLTTLTSNTIADGSRFAFVAKLNASGTGLTYATRVGGSYCADFFCYIASTNSNGIAIDSQGNAWITGTTGSNQFPMVKPLYSTFATTNGPDLFAAKLTPSGTSLAFSTLLNGQTLGVNGSHGPGGSMASAIAVDSIGSAYITGRTDKLDFPTTAGALRVGPLAAGSIVANAFVTKINESKDTTTALVASPNPGSTAAPLTLTATVTGNAPTGSVTFKDDNTTLGTVPLSGSTAQHVLSSPAGGAHHFKDKYPGDAHNNPSVSAVLNVNVTNAQPPTITMTGIANGTSFTANSGSTYTGGEVTLQAAAAAGNLLNRITLFVDSSSTSTYPNQLNYPATSWPLPALGVGQHTIAAAALDNRGRTTSTTPVQIVVNPAGAGAPPTNVVITSPANGASFVSPAQITLAISAMIASPKTVASVAYFQGNSNLASATSSPYTYTWSNMPPGSYVFTAMVTDSGGAFAYSPPITITVTAPPPPPTVSITAPTSGASYAAPATIAITANATAAAGGTITQVEFLNGSTVIGTATSPPYTFNWPNVAAGSYTLKARATDGWTSTTTSTGVPVTVMAPPPPTVSISAPPGGASFGAPAMISITANAMAAAGGSITQVEFLNGTTVIGSATTAPYTFSWPNVAAGNYTLTARATDSWTSMTTSTAVPVTVAMLPLSIAAAAGLNGSTVDDTRVLVNGTVVAPPNSAVTVNGILAALGTNGEFAVNDVPVVTGPNTITLTVTTQDGATATQAISVNGAANSAPFSISVDPAEGIAPLTVYLTLQSGGMPVSTVEVDVEGDGVVDITSYGLPASAILATYPGTGTMRPQFTFKDSSGAVIRTERRQIEVASPLDRYNLVKGVYNDMIDRLKAGNIDGAVSLLTTTIREKYRSYFTSLGTGLAAAANSLGTLKSASVGNDFARLTIVRSESGGPYGYLVYIIRDGDGIWRIDGM